MSDEREHVLELAVRLARSAGAIQRERCETELEIGTKTSAVDLVTDVDHACEKRILDGLASERPHDAVLAEESGAGGAPTASARARWRWIIDPLDGTVNFAHGYPCFCVSIGIEYDGRRELAVVYDPMRDDLYHALRGGGAFRNGEPIRVSDESDLGRSMIGTGFGYDRQQEPEQTLRNVTAMLGRARALRRDGSAALDLCAVACGRFDGFWELGLAPWDVAAGILLVEEAGGRCSDLAGGPVPASGAQLVASNGRIHEAMLAVVRTL